MKTLALALAAMLATGSTPALAEPDLNRAIVSYEDLDLRSAEGQATLDRRLEKAIAEGCRVPHSRSVRVASETQACIADLRDQVAKLRARIITEAQRHAAQDKRD